MARAWSKIVDNEVGQEGSLAKLVFHSKEVPHWKEGGQDKLVFHSKEGGQDKLSPHWKEASQDDLIGGEGNDNFLFSAPGDFTVQDFDTVADKIVFDSGSTGITDLNGLLSSISGIGDSNEGVVVDFVDDIASITLVGLQTTDLSAGMVDFI